MKPAGKLLAALAVLLLALALTGCGGGGSSGGTEATETEVKAPPVESNARQRLIAEADAICNAHRPVRRELQKEVVADSEALNASETGANRKALADDLRRAVDVAESELDELRDLPPPPGEAMRLNRIILAAEAGSVGALVTAEAVEAGDPKKVEEAVEQTRSANEGARKLAREYGFEVCGQGPE